MTLNMVQYISYNKAMRPSRWRTDALLQCRCSGIEITHRYAASSRCFAAQYLRTSA